jgi:di/tricarboxylate transporter
MFDYAPVGITIAAVGLICLTLTYRLLPARRGGASLDAAINIENYVAELRVPEGSPVVGQTARDVEALAEGAATVLMMAPIAASLASKLGLNPDPFLMAVAVGAACDFLTPFGHQCNTLVMGPGGYRFSDYWKLGLPLSIMVLVVGVPVIAMVWQLSAR